MNFTTPFIYFIGALVLLYLVAGISCLLGFNKDLPQSTLKKLYVVLCWPRVFYEIDLLMRCYTQEDVTIYFDFLEEQGVFPFKATDRVHLEALVLERMQMNSIHIEEEKGKTYLEGCESPAVYFKEFMSDLLQEVYDTKQY